MDTGRISLPSIDCMLNAKSHLQTPSPPPLFTSHANSRSISQSHQQDQKQQHPYVSLPYSSPSSSTTWKYHSRSHSMDHSLASSTTPSFPQQQQQQKSPPSSSIAGLPPPLLTSPLGSAVSPSHERSTRMSPFLTSSQQPPWKNDPYFHYHHHPPPASSRRHHHHHHHQQQHQRSTSYTMGMNYNTVDNSTTTGSLHNMIVNNTPPRKYICPHCTKSFSRPSSLRTHIFSHSGEKPFACPYQGCHRSFSVQSNMRRHIRVHYSASLASSSHST